MQFSISRLIALLALPLLLAACASGPRYAEPPRSLASSEVGLAAPTYRIGPGDELDLTIWNEPDLSMKIPVRPDGRFSAPLVDDILAAGRSAAELARALEVALAPYLLEPRVSVQVSKFGNRNRQTIRVLGEVGRPAALPYRAGMRVTDVLTAVGGVSQFAQGNGAVLVRTENGERKQYGLRLDDLIRSGDVSADRPLLPGDIIIIPQSVL
ncbi:MAG: polysaccharide biosynthesis/export family protein [Neomegalonema sp.]|nr:polysaccharide biosynthesis/export family protein [Neomegalonema sp.]